LIGLKELYGSSVVDYTKQSHNYTSHDPNDIKRFWGQGMTVTRVLPDLDVDRTNITDRIKNSFYDLVVYGSIWRCDSYIEEILKYYPPHKVVAVDGEDHTSIHQCINLNVQYFKRELVYNTNKIQPIWFALPTSKISSNTKKIKDLAHINPLDRSTYIYDNEKDYYNDYKEARFAITLKKAGWDCMRHYEIMGNECIPYFIELEKCPPRTMVSFPKQEIIEVFHKLNAKESPQAVYELYKEKVLSVFNEKLTTKALAKYFIETVLNEKP
jgi:hypothetical protein